MPKAIGENELGEYGIFTNHEKMDNGELRFRMLSEDRSCYIRGENREQFVWGNSHSHKETKEMIIMQKGTAIFVEYEKGQTIFRRLLPGDIFISRPGIPHNHCFDKGTVVHTIKFGSASENDWIACPVLDRLTQQLTLEEALAHTGETL